MESFEDQGIPRPQLDAATSQLMKSPSRAVLPTTVNNESDRLAENTAAVVEYGSGEKDRIGTHRLRSPKNAHHHSKAHHRDHVDETVNSEVQTSGEDRITTMTSITTSVIVGERRDAIVLTENRLIADPITGRVESLPSPSRPGDTPVVNVNSDRQSDRSDERVSSSRSQIGSQTQAADDGRKSSLPSALKESDQRRGHGHPLRFQAASQITIEEEGEFSPRLVPKSAAQSGSPQSTPRRSSLGRLLNPLQSMSSRIHPVTITYAPRADRRDSDEDAETPPAQSMSSAHNTRTDPQALVSQTVHVAEKKPPVTSHTQRSVYVKTHESLAELFGKPTQSRNGLLVLRVVFVCIILNIGTLAMETCDGQNHGSSSPGYPYLPTEDVYKAADAFFAIIFSLEFAGRMIAR